MIKALVNYDDDEDEDSPDSFPAQTTAKRKIAEEEEEQQQQGPTATPSYCLPLLSSKLVSKKKRKTVRWADAGMLEEVFTFDENRPVDKNAKMPSPEEEGQEDTPSPAVPAPPIPPSPSSPSRLSGLLYQPLETVTTVRKAASALHTAGGKEKWASPSSSWWGGPQVVVDREGDGDGSGASEGSGAHPHHSQHHLNAHDGPYDPSQFEFFCDRCQYTIEKQEIRYECAECPSEFCLCEECYDEVGSTHPHPCTLNRLPFHVTLMDSQATT